MAKPSISVLPTEVELVLEVMPCQAMRRSYDSTESPHPCAYFAEWGFYHSFDYKDSGPPPRAGIEHQSTYRGKRPLVPEILSGCRKAPIMCVGINPNLPGWTQSSRNAAHPYFEDYLQYAHYFRYRSTAKLRINAGEYRAALGKRDDPPSSARALVDDGKTIGLELDPVTMYGAYQSLLDGLAEAEGWRDHKLSVGEDLSYANMVACGSARWVVRPNPDDTMMPAMGQERARGIVNECFVKRRYFLRQLTQSLANVLLVFSATTAEPFIRAMQNRFRPEGAPKPEERLDELIEREIRLEYGRLPDGTLLDARVIFLPHASARPKDFERVKGAAIRHLREEVAAKRLVYRPETGHLARPRGGCFFCTNELYQIGTCDYREELTPLAESAVRPLSVDAPPALEPLLEKSAQMQLLRSFVGEPTEAAQEMRASEVWALDAAAPSAPAMVLFGKVVPMTEPVIDDAALYLRQGKIVAIRGRQDPAPAGFNGAPRIETQGVIYPGLLDLHNHLAYNILPLWIAGQAFKNRNQWMKLPNYRRFVSQPMTLLTKRRPDLIKAIVRYVEVKLILGGVTSGQGMRSTFGGVPYFRGIVRNFEISADAALPSARHRVPDLRDKPDDIEKFRRHIASGSPFFFHLAEGKDDLARAQFQLLERERLLASNLIAVHCTGLKRPDFQKLASANAKVVWSPLSNLLLYGKTLDLKALMSAGAPFSLGSDWTPSGSRNLLLEMKVAWLTAKDAGDPLTPEDIAKAATIVAARSAGWGEKLGSIEDGKYADLLVLDDNGGDPYENLVSATEKNIRLVIVAGHVRYGDEALVRAAKLSDDVTEALEVGGRSKRLHLHHPASPLSHISLATAAEVLNDEMSDLERAESRGLFQPLGLEAQDSIELDFQVEEDEIAISVAAALPPIKSLELDALTIVDDGGYFDVLESVSHLPAYLTDRPGLRSFYQ